MVYVGVKLLITAGLIVLISEIAKRNALFGGFIAAMPLVTLFVLFWMYFEGVPEKKIGSHALFTLVYVIPTLPMFLIFPFLLERVGFYGSMLISIIVTLFLAYITHILVSYFGLSAN
tara:strand:+ start:894 stop:1244 length:351 start_codon:yes stop_codon:yes gene_type:complete